MSQPPLIKICGITRLGDAQAVLEAGADALGLVFTAQSGRRVELPVAAEIASAVQGRLCRVGLFVDSPAREVEAVLEKVSLDLLQFQGEEPASFCGRFGVPYMKAHRVGATLDIRALERAYPDACCLHLDAFVPGQPGGTGQRFDWRLWPEDATARLVLAGGLTPENVGEAVRSIRPYAVDVSGGVEAGVRGIKDPEMIRRFVAAVREAGVHE